MKCSICGGLVTWRGPLTDLTHTECNDCGGINCQIFEDYTECETCEGTGVIDERIGGISRSNPESVCPDCDGKGYL
jgi:DnaJ-class molecular chaperone